MDGQEDDGHDHKAKEAAVTPYATASWASRATWAWMNPLVSRGRRAALQPSDVPALAPPHRPERVHERFAARWPSSSSPATGGENSKNPVRRALLRCFWPQLLLNAALALARAAAMYVGPLLIRSFVEFCSSSAAKAPPLWHGARLVLFLLAAKAFEAFCGGQYAFRCAALGTQVRGALAAALYRKGLRLSSAARRRAHGASVVNLVAVDAQQLADMAPTVNYLWLTPLQLAVALALLHAYVGGAATLSALAVVALVLASAQRKSLYQTRMMSAGDARVRALSEMLGGMRAVKLHAWERHFRARVAAARRAEFGWVARFTYSVGCNIVAVWSAPLLISALLFAACELAGAARRLDAGAAFTATAFVQTLQEPMRFFPRAMIQASQALVSLRRLDAYMTSEELDVGAVARENAAAAGDSGTAVRVEDGVFTWDDDDDDQQKKKAALRGTDFEARAGELVAFVGAVGSGKSSLLGCVLGEMRRVSGTVMVRGRTACVAQTAWIQSSTVMDNILFGLPMDAERYAEVVRACCLEKDLEVMEFGDMTEIGERGVTLSGGQRQRVQLARAVYQDCDVYLLDDVFSAVDAHTGADIFRECVRGALKNKTVVLVTHQTDFLHNADAIYVMKDGMIVQSGKYDELLQQGSEFAALVAAHDTSMAVVESARAPGTEKKTNTLPRTEAASSSSTAAEASDAAGKRRLVKDEERASGRVSLAVYKHYMTASAWGWWAPAAVLAVSAAWQAAVAASDYWLAYATSSSSVRPPMFVAVYSAIAAASVALMAARSLLVAAVGLQTADRFFQQILDSVVHAPMSFFDTTPSGRILCRASSDQKNVDLVLPLNFWLCMATYITVISVLIGTCLVAWPTVVAVFPLMALNFWYLSYYLPTSRELTRLESITNAPVIHHFKETIHGVMTIRCFGKEDSFFRENLDCELHLEDELPQQRRQRVAQLPARVDGKLCSLPDRLAHGHVASKYVNPKFVGLSLSYGLSLNSALFLAISTSCFLENKMVSVERIKQFSNIPSEAEWSIKGCLPVANWPTEGAIDVIDLKVRYRPNSPLVLKGITVSIHAGEKIGVVGRTGSGKSTLIQALFRIVEPSEGKIIIDGVDIGTLGLHDLRSKLGIIPQEPVLFEGTIRTNIDPLQQYSDNDIWLALDRCQLKDAVTTKPEKLDAPGIQIDYLLTAETKDAVVSDNGENWSVGQRQLLCLGRVMLKHSRILFMDEATASVDSQTDAVIQKIIREDFAECTIVSIAHRIPTIMDCDRVLVMDEGHAKEFEQPVKLLESPSLFGALVQEYTNRSG